MSIGGNLGPLFGPVFHSLWNNREQRMGLLVGKLGVGKGRTPYGGSDYSLDTGTAHIVCTLPNTATIQLSGNSDFSAICK